MFRKVLLAITLFIPFCQVFGQVFTTPSTYHDKENPCYWKHNKLLDKNYWQQDVHYKIKAIINDSTDIITGDYELKYWNNSPDTLHYLYFHLYQNAFQPHSHMTSLYENNHIDIKYGKYEKQGLGTTVENISIKGESVTTELDNTILKVFLNEPLLPHSKLTVKLDFKTYYDIGTLRRRMKTFNKFGFKHYDGVHWYPSICVYDRKFGWTTEQHTDKEFYADFGTFDVALTFPNDYIVDATGILQNRHIVLPKALRDTLDISKYKKYSGTISTPIQRDDSKPKTWIFHAENVHNFAFTADPTYRIGELKWNGVKIITLAQEPNAKHWQESGKFARDVIKTYSNDFGMYIWPKIIIADAQDGMEYPMLTLDGGKYPRHQGLLAHEIGHMWFYGMLGSNETYRAFLDEGFTQFLTIWSMDTLTGKSNNYKRFSNYTNRNKYPYQNRYHYLYYPYIKTVRHGYDMPLNTHSGDFNGATRHGGGYGLVYYKAGVMLYNLRYVLGDELFQNAMKYYVNKFKIAHPYPEDFRQSIIEYTKVDLNWFFDQWLETTKTIDYRIDKVKKKDGKYTIIFERKGEMQMPLDFTITLKSGKQVKYHIPNTWFVKDTKDSVLTRWYGWGNMHKTYEATIQMDEKIKQIEIDPDHYIADIDLTNNVWKNSIDFQFENFTPNIPYWYKSEHFIRPYLWANSEDFLHVGLRLKGNYFKQKYKYDGAVWLNLGKVAYLDNSIATPYVSWQLSTTQSLGKYWRNLSATEYFHQKVGVWKGGLTLKKKFQPRDMRNSRTTTIYTNIDIMYRNESVYTSVLPYYNNLWTYKLYNNTISFGIDRTYPIKKGKGILSTKLRTAGFFSDVQYTYLEAENIHHKKIWRTHLHTRMYGRLGSDTPVESALWAYGANPEKRFDNRYTQANSIAILHYGGGLNLRGYFNKFPLIGNSGASTNIEWDFNGITKKKIPFISRFIKLKTYLFMDGAILENRIIENNVNNNLYFDAGIGGILTFLIPHSTINPLNIRLDYSAYNTIDESTQFTVGINRSF